MRRSIRKRECFLAFLLILCCGCHKLSTEKALSKNWNVLSWLEETQHLTQAVPADEIRWESINLEGKVIRQLPLIHAVTSKEKPIGMIIKMRSMPGANLSGLEGQFILAVPSLLSLDIFTEKNKRIRLASLPLPASAQTPLSFHFNLMGNKELQEGQISRLYLLWTPEETLSAKPSSLNLNHLKLLGKKKIYDLASPVITTLTEKSGNYLLYSRALLIPAGQSLDLCLRGGKNSKILFRGRSLTQHQACLEFQHKNLFGYRPFAALEFGERWRSASVDLASFSGENTRIRLRNPSQGIIAMSAVYFQSGDLPLPRSVALLIFDALRRDALGIYGYPQATSPNIDAFAREHVVFEKAMSAGPQTAWSVLHMLTSSWGPFKINEAQRVADSLKLLPKEIQRRGYINIGITENVHSASVHNLNQGYDLFIELDMDPQDRLHDDKSKSPAAAVAAIQDVVPLLTQAGFFFYVHFLKPHFPYTPSAEGFKPFDFHYRGAINAESENASSFLNQAWSTLLPADRRQIRALYNGSIRDCDTAFATILKELKSKRILDRTLMVIAADHGELFGEHEGYRAYNRSMECLGNGHPLFFSQPTLAIPLIFSFPGDRSQKVTQPVSLIDLFPSFFDFLSIHTHVKIQGKSLFPLILGEKWPQRRLYSTCRFSQYMSVALVDGNRKVLRYYYRQKGKWLPAESEIYDISDFSKDREIKLTDRERQLLFDQIDLFLKRQLIWIDKQSKVISQNLTDEQTAQLKALGYLQ